MKKFLLAPSLLSANFSYLEKDISAAEKAGADLFHCDIMDGHFVPNISFGPSIVKSVNRMTDIPLDVHLMVSYPDHFLKDFKEAGADYCTVHVETCLHLHRTIAAIKELGMKAGVSLNPATPLSVLREILPFVDLILVMSVNPGFGGQLFIPQTLDKIISTSRLIKEKKADVLLEVDGGIDRSNIRSLVDAGATAIVAGTAVFGKGDIGQAIASLREG